MSFIKDIYKRLFWGYFEKKNDIISRSRITNKNFSIITSNCCGGIIYHRLGMRFDSPTVNTWISQKDFCRFASNLDYYLSQELRFFKDENRNCPCAYLGNKNNAITVNFVHYKTEDEAREKWEERKHRIHWDNLYIITCDGNGSLKEDFDLLKKANCKRFIVFTSHDHPEIDNSFTLYTMKKYKTAGSMQLRRHLITGLRPWEREFDYVAWLNDESDFRI